MKTKSKNIATLTIISVIFLSLVLACGGGTPHGNPRLRHRGGPAGQGIAAHLDEMPHPDSQVVTISLLDSYPMEFARIGTEEKFEQWLARRSVAVMNGASRTEWTHEILKRKADLVQGGGRRVRGRRVSVTYRTMLFVVQSSV